MIRNFLFLPYHNTGGHFIDWSLYYLRGHDRYWFDGGWQPLVIPDAVSQLVNFHFHKSQMIAGSDQCSAWLGPMHCDTDMMNLYVRSVTKPEIAQSKFQTSYKNLGAEQQQSVMQYIHNDTADVIQKIQHSNYNLIVFDYCTTDLMNIVYNNRKPLDGNNQFIATQIDEIWNNHIKIFYSNSIDRFETNIWDRREQLALVMVDFLPFLNQNIGNLINQQQPHLYYNTDDVWNDFPAVVQEIADFVGFEIVPDRFAIWLDIYRRWRENHKFAFARHYDRILDAIVNNRYMRLDRFNLNFYHEVLIQSGLISRYNLNLKNWQLERFPNNTQDLHLLLEPNFH